MKKVKFLIKHALLNIYIKKLYDRYVVSNELLQMDIQYTFILRNCQTNVNSGFLKFKHLMKYYPSFVFVFFWRIKNSGWFFKSLFNIPNYNCKIFGNTKIQGGLNCFHPFATVINAKSIGENFEFRNGLTIGNKNNDNNLLPIIGNNVVVGANVCIIGDITIGNNVIIGAGAVVVKDVPNNVIIAGNPAKVIKTIDVV
jgi:serine O-acetyltransferase